MGAERQSILRIVSSVCIIISVGHYLLNKQIPIFTTQQNFFGISTMNWCDSATCSNCSNYVGKGPYIAPGPSKIQDVISMSVLQKKVHFDSFRGLKYLDHTSLSRYYRCHSTSKYQTNDSIKWCDERVFLKNKSPLVALVSFHGSGNTWLRYLLEQASGIFTGSIYCDEVLKSIFPGESVVSGNVIAIKTHHADATTLPKDVQLATGREKYDKAVLLIRDPFDALVSEANRRWNSKRSLNNHIGLADETSFISKF